MANNITVKDASGNNVILTTVESGGVHTPVQYEGRPSTVVFGEKTVATAGTAEALGAATTLRYGVTVKALSANTGAVYVGGSTVSAANGFHLAADEEIFVPVDDLSKIYIDAAVNGEGVRFIGG